jgi:hypothetical protein
MKKIITLLGLLSILLVSFPSTSLAVSSISGTITDPAGAAYANGTYEFTFIGGPGGVNIGTGESVARVAGALNGSGAFSGVTLGNTDILGGGSRWQVKICAVNGQCFTTLINVTASTSSLSTILQAAAPLLTGASMSGTAAANSTFAFANYTNAWTWGAATGASTNPFTLTDTTLNTGTGYLEKVITTAGSALGGFQVVCGNQASAAAPANAPACVTLTAGNGGVSTVAGTPGSNGGTITKTTGTGGAGAATGTGGNGGEGDLITGNGGAAAGVGSLGGNGGLIKLLGGTGGGTVNGGVGGALTMTAGPGGNGSTTGGTGGALTLGSGAAGTGGTGTSGAVALKSGASTVLGVTGLGAITMASPGTNLTNEFLFTGTAQSGTPANSVFSVVDTTGNTTTGPLLDVHTVGNSTALPVRITAQGSTVGVQMSAAGVLSPISTGKIAPRWNDVTAAGAAQSIANTIYTTAISHTNPAGAADAITFSMGTATSTSNLLTLSDGAANTGTGYLLNLSHGAASLANDLKITAAAQTGSPSNSQINILDTTSNTNTGPLVNIHTAGSSTALPIQITAVGTANGVQMTAAGLLQKMGSGSIKADASTSPTDGYYWVPLQACGMQLTTGALAAASTVGQNPGIQYVAANNMVLGVTTSGAASAVTIDCDISPPSRTTSTKGITITGVRMFYGYQGAATPNSIAGPTFSQVVYSAAAGAAAATLTTVGGALTTTVGTSHSTPGAVTTTGQCYSELTTFGTPFVANSDLTRYTAELVINHTTASLATYQLCGVAVDYTNGVL